MYARVEELGLPMLWHSGTSPYSHPLQIAYVARHFPAVPFILAHFALSDLTWECFPAADLADNVMVDTTANPIVPVLEDWLGRFGAERMLWGTDFPFYDVAYELMKLDRLAISPDDRRTDRRRQRAPSVRAARGGGRMRATAVIEEALGAFFADLDAERWDRLAERLHVDVELADEVTGHWLRGRERVAAYLRAQAGIVTDVRSNVGARRSRWLTDEIGLVTFVDRARYRLEKVEHRENLTGSALFSFEEGEWRLLLFHLGAQAVVRGPEADGPPAEVLDQRPTAGAALRRRRKLVGLSLRALAEKADVSASFLSQVERGVGEPSVATLTRLADALQVPVASLLGGPAPLAHPEQRVVRRAGRRRVAVPAAGAELELLTDDAATALEASIVTVAAGERDPRERRHSEPGERLLLVIAGAMKLAMAADEVVLRAGDSITVPAGEPYGLANGADAPLVYVTALARSIGRQASPTDERSIK